MLFRDTVGHMLAISTPVKWLVADAVTVVHAGDVVVTKDGRYHKLILIGLTLFIEDVFSEDAVNIMSVALGKERLDF